MFGFGALHPTRKVGGGKWAVDLAIALIDFLEVGRLDQQHVARLGPRFGGAFACGKHHSWL